MKRSRLRAGFGRRPLFRKKAGRYSMVLMVIIVVIILLWIMNNNIRPLLLAMSEVKARIIATQIINEAVSTELTYKIKYDDLFIVKTDTENRVTMLQANTMMMNSIASETALNIQEQFRQMGTKKVRVPLGSILGSEIFANYGPALNIEILPAGTVSVDFTTNFEQAGINQTRHKIYLTVKTQVRVVVPLVSERVDVETQIPIAETIIVGDIPEYYIYVPEKDLLHVVPETRVKE